MKRIETITVALIAGALALVAGCGDDSGATAATGAVQIFVQPEDTIPDGLEPGTGPENIADGWKIAYDRFLVTVGDVRAARSDATEKEGDPAVYVLDLKHAPAGGYIISELKDISAVRWDRFGFDLPNAKAGVKSLPPTAGADVAFMVENGYSIYFEGSMEKADGESRPPSGPPVPATRIAFRWGLPAGTSFDDCATADGITGFAVPAGGTVQVKPTIHGDHWFFNNLTSGTELTARYAQYIADCDLDGDGETTLDELKQVDAAVMFPSPKYNLSGALGGAVLTAYDYVLAQARTLGDFQGDGECPTRKPLP